MDKLLTCVQAAFPDFEQTTLDDHLPLATFEGWDSMTAVSFLLELEHAYGVKLVGEMFKKDSTIADVKALLRTRGVQI